MSKRRLAPLTFLRRLLFRTLVALVVFWGGGIALFSVVPVPFSAVMAERQISAWLSGEFSYVAHSDWVSMEDISPWDGASGDGGGRPEVP
ncbi:monofunctional biosynthetic peptidoglycan transglycosylase [Salmonella enterica subsp. arizonae]|uniref:Monofunctional biosynthetic peptidoglycan transglycosylase n=1 Tax=Salmonella enterica subsp. arizonae TaxID=59203 RepID=A0A379T5K5_SALER|nr:monofunctional biosynthetic peptidoglycan transglycosylase [Salmonella enterica subsp. arizonae]